VSCHGFKMRSAMVVKNFESQFRNSFSRSATTYRKERRYSMAGCPHCAHQCPCRSAPQFSQCVSGGPVFFPRPNWRRPGVPSNALIAVSPRIIFAGSSDIQQRCYKIILPASTQHAPRAAMLICGGWLPSSASPLTQGERNEMKGFNSSRKDRQRSTLTFLLSLPGRGTPLCLRND
jgi:hypothetical protein